MQSVGIRLYLPDAVLDQRIEPAKLAAYIHALERQLIGTCILQDLSPAKGLLIAIGARPGKTSRVWCEVLEGDLPAELVADIAADMQGLPVPVIEGGPIAFAFHIQIQEDDPPVFPDVPAAWLRAANALGVGGINPDAIFATLWPD